MKKTVFWLVVSMILFVVAPLVIRSGIRYSYNASTMLLVLFVPLYFVILGISVGKSIKRHWFLPVVSLALSFISYTFILNTRQYRNYGTIATLIIIYMVLFATSMLLTVAFFKVTDRKRVLKKSIIISCTVSGVGFFINLISYLLFKDFPLGITRWGGDYSGKSGFGLLLNRVYPMTAMGEPAPKNTVWLSFEPVSLVISIVAVFAVSLICILIWDVLKNRNADKRQNAN